MKKRTFIAAALCAATLVAGGIAGTSAMAGGQDLEYEVYNYTFYSNESGGTVVGHGRTRCSATHDYTGTYYMISGTHSPHYHQELMAMCVNGVWQPL